LIFRVYSQAPEMSSGAALLFCRLQDPWQPSVVNDDSRR
jgi:hypothetical protein